MTRTVQLPPAAMRSLAVQVPPDASGKVPASALSTEKLVSVSAAVPVFVSVIVVAADVVPTAWLLKVTDVGERPTVS